MPDFHDACCRHAITPLRIIFAAATPLMPPPLMLITDVIDCLAIRFAAVYAADMPLICCFATIRH